MRAHTDSEIIRQADKKEKDSESIRNNRIDIAVDMEDDHDIMHTYVVNFSRDAEGNWSALEVSELSSL